MGFFNSSFMFESSLAGARQFFSPQRREGAKEAQRFFLLNLQRCVRAYSLTGSHAKVISKYIIRTLTLPTANFSHSLLYNLLQTGWAVADRLDRFVIRLSIDKPFVSFLEVVTFRSVLFPVMFNRLLSFIF